MHAFKALSEPSFFAFQWDDACSIEREDRGDMLCENIDGRMGKGRGKHLKDPCRANFYALDLL